MSVKAPLSIHGLLAGKQPSGVIFQFLDQCMEEFKKVRGGSRVSFVTPEHLDHASVHRGQCRMQKAGLILWFDRDYIDQSLTMVPPDTVPPQAFDALRQMQCALRQLQELGLLKEGSVLEQQPSLATLQRELDRLMGPLA